MPLKGKIIEQGGATTDFDFPDPTHGEIQSGRIQVRPGFMRIFMWFPKHMVPNGSGRALIKRGRVGKAIDACNLPIKGSTGTLTDNEAEITIYLTRE